MKEDRFAKQTSRMYQPNIFICTFLALIMGEFGKQEKLQN